MSVDCFYLINSRVYSIRGCTLEEIPSHIERVISYWADVDMEQRMMELQEAVEAGNFIKLYDEDGCQDVAAIAFKTAPRLTILGLLGWTTRFKNLIYLGYYLIRCRGLQRLLFRPHNIGSIPFSYAVHKPSIDVWRSYNTYLEVKASRVYYLLNKYCHGNFPIEV